MRFWTTGRCAARLAPAATGSEPGSCGWNFRYSIAHGKPVLNLLSLCWRDCPNPWATRRYAEIVTHLER